MFLKRGRVQGTSVTNDFCFASNWLRVMLDFLKQLQIKVAQNPDYFHLSIENHSTECTAPSLLS